MKTAEELLFEIAGLEDTIRVMTKTLAERDERIRELERLLAAGKRNAENAQAELAEFLEAVRWEA